MKKIYWTMRMTFTRKDSKKFRTRLSRAYSLFWTKWLKGSRRQRRQRRRVLLSLAASRNRPERFFQAALEKLAQFSRKKPRGSALRYHARHTYPVDWPPFVAVHKPRRPAPVGRL